MIQVSTGGIKNQAITKTIEAFYQAGIRQIELSGGPYLPGGLEELKKCVESFPGLRVSVHNYFPVPQDHFVLNLGSLDDAVFSKSMAHVRHAIDWASELGSPWYSFHAGFLIDPQVKEIGKTIGKRKLFDRTESLARFLAAVKDVAKYAHSKSVKLLVENNVLSQKNAEEFGENPLLCVTPDETEFCMKELRGSAELLVDLAHLKVSAESLNFDPVDFLKRCEPYIGAYHLSDNDGTADTNENFTKNAWFFPYLKKSVHFHTVEVYGTTPEALKEVASLVKGEVFS